MENIFKSIGWASENPHESKKRHYNIPVCNFKVLNKLWLNKEFNLALGDAKTETHNEP
jgi:hypothetical protein